VCHGYDNQKEFSAATFFQNNEAFGLVLARFCKNINLDREGAGSWKRVTPRYASKGKLDKKLTWCGVRGLQAFVESSTWS
jgi:hypothetical protein